MVVDNAAACAGNTILSWGDNALICAYREGNEYALEVLLDRYRHKLVNYIHNLIHDYDLAADLAQEAFIRVYRNANRYQGQYQFSTWLYRIATNLAIDEIRRRNGKGRFFFHNVWALFQDHPKSYPLPDIRHCPEKTLDQKEKMELLQRALASLPQKYRIPFVLREIQDLSYEQTGQVMKISLGTVKSRIHRAKMLLREKLAGVL